MRHPVPDIDRPREECSLTDQKTLELIASEGAKAIAYAHNAKALVLALLIHGKSYSATCLDPVEKALGEQTGGHNEVSGNFNRAFVWGIRWLVDDRKSL